MGEAARHQAVGPSHGRLSSSRVTGNHLGTGSDLFRMRVNRPVRPNSYLLSVSELTIWSQSVEGEAQRLVLPIIFAEERPRAPTLGHFL